MSQNTLIQRAAVVAEARRWIGTPYHHQADVLGAGVDCGMLLVRVYVDAGIRSHAPVVRTVAQLSAFRLIRASGCTKRTRCERRIPALNSAESVLSTSNGPLVLPVCEIKTGSGIFDYKVKFTPRLIDERMPAEISPVLNSKLQNLGAGIFQKLGCAGFARIDVIVDKFEDPYVLEVNTLPGLLPTSIFPKACMAAGIPYNDMIRMLLENALDAKPMEIKKQIELKELPDDIKQAMA